MVSGEWKRKEIHGVDQAKGFLTRVIYERHMCFSIAQIQKG